MITLKSFEQFVTESAVNEEGVRIEQATDKLHKQESQEEESKEKESTEDAEQKEQRSVADMLKECYEAMKREAATWESDEHDEHTIESYMTEIASLVGKYSANTLKDLREDYALEAYEAACNSIKEAFCKKIDEAKEINMSSHSQTSGNDGEEDIPVAK